MICQINGALTFFNYYFNCFFLRLIITCRLWVIYVREDNYIVFQCIGYDYMAYMDYKDPDVLCP